MIEIELEQNLLLQLNILLWMARPGKTSWINPYYYKQGYEIYMIEPELSLPPKILKILKENDIKTLKNPHPEFVLFNKDENIFILVECKTRGFDLTREDNRKTQQAMALLCFNGDIIADSFGEKDDLDYQAFLCYNLVITDYIKEFARNLHEKKEYILQKRINKVNSSGVSYFENDDNQIYLVHVEEENDKAFCNILNFKKRIQVMTDESDSITPPLYLIPVEPSSNDDYAKVVFYKRLKSRLGSLLANYPEDQDEIVLDTDSDILNYIIPVWGNWGNRDSKSYVRRKTSDCVKETLNLLDNKIEKFKYARITNGFKLINYTREVREKVKREYMKSEIRKEDNNKKFIKYLNNQMKFDF